MGTIAINFEGLELEVDYDEDGCEESICVNDINIQEWMTDYKLDQIREYFHAVLKEKSEDEQAHAHYDDLRDDNRWIRNY